MMLDCHPPRNWSLPYSISEFTDNKNFMAQCVVWYRICLGTRTISKNVD